MKANSKMLTIAFSVVQAINKVDMRATVRAISHDQIGSKKGLTFSKILSYCSESFEGFVVETMGKDFRIFSACSE